VFLDYFDVLMSKIIFKNKKHYFNIFLSKKHFKNNRNYFLKHALHTNVVSIVHLDGDARAIVLVTINA
jgi:hypothetical protein